MTFYVTPYRQMAAMRHAMHHWLNDSMGDHASMEREMLLAVDVQETDEAYTITALVPGLESDALGIEVLDNTVTIRGEFKSAEDDKAEFLRNELPCGKFSRVITLPTALDEEKVEASMKNGVLSLHIPKAEIDRPKSIKVKIE